MLSKEQIDLLVDNYITGLFDELERDVISDIVRRVKKTGRYTETAELQAQALKAKGYSPAEIQAKVHKQMNADKKLQAEIAKNTLEYKQEVVKRIKEVEKEAEKAGDKLVAEAGDMSFRDDLSAWEEHGESLKAPNDLAQLKKSIAKQTADSFRNITKTMGFKNTVLGTTGVLQAYQREMDLAVVKVASGSFSLDQAVQQAVKTLAKSGLRSIDYESGRSYQLDTAARMCVRTAMGQLTGKIQEENVKQLKTPLVFVPAHAGSRPEHAIWQGKVYSYGKKVPGYKDLVEATGYGTVTGLMGVNCRHNFYPYWEGDPIPEFKEPDPVTIDGKTYTYYEATQAMRKQEREIRAQKREIEANQALGNDTAEMQAQLKQMRSRYIEFGKDAGVTPRLSALQVNRGTSGYDNPTIQESGLHTGNENTSVNWKKVKSKEYTKAFVDLTNSEKGGEKLAQRARNALKNRDGKDTEEIYAIDLNTGKDISKITNQNHSLGIVRTKKFESDIKRAEENGAKIAFIHNHPGSSPPSAADLNELLNNNDAVGFIAAHDGTIYYYTKPNGNVKNSEIVVAMMKTNTYNEKEQQHKAMEEVARHREFIYKRIL